MARRTVIPEEQLKQAKERIEKGECTYGEAAKALGIGDMALRGNFQRAGIVVAVPKRGRHRSSLLSKPGNDKPGGWDVSLMNRMLQKPWRKPV